MDELLALKHAMKLYNTRVDNYMRDLVHYSIIQSMSALSGPLSPPVITKVNIQETYVSLNNIKKVQYSFFDSFHTFLSFSFLINCSHQQHHRQQCLNPK